jgi:glycogen(starch) synthase
MRVCLVTREYHPVTDYSGGIGTQYGAIAPALAAAGVELHVLTLSPRRPAPPGPEVRVHLLGRAPRRLFDRAGWSLLVAGALRELGRFDVVIAPEWGGDAWRYARRQDRGPLVTHLHTARAQVRRLQEGLTPLDRINPWGLAQELAESRQAERSRAIAACSEALLEWTRSLWRIGELPARVLPNAIDTALVRERGEAGELPDGFPADGPVVVYSGRLEGRKGVRVLLEAMGHVWSELPDTRLALIGQDGPWRGGSMATHLLELAGAHRRRVHVLGHQPAERLFPAVSAADVVAAPSLWEAFGLSALEAMALARSVVVTTGSGFDEFARPEENALAVQPGSASALADAIARLLQDDQLRRRLGSRAAADAERFDTSVVALRYLEFLAQVSGGAASARPSEPERDGTPLRPAPGP